MDTLPGISPLSDLLERYTRAAAEAARALGVFTLFGLFERTDSPGRYDIIVSAPWLMTDRDGIVKVARFLPKLRPGESALIGSLVPLSPHEEFVRTVNRMIPDHDGRALETGSGPLGGVEIMHAFILSSHKESTRRAAEAAAA